MTQVLSLTPLEFILIGLAAGGIFLFFRACWRNIQQERESQLERENLQEWESLPEQESQTEREKRQSPTFNSRRQDGNDDDAPPVIPDDAY